MPAEPTHPNPPEPTPPRPPDDAPAPELQSLPLTGLRLHPQAALIPSVSGRELTELTADIARRGITDPLHVTADGVVLDGRARLAAARQLGHHQLSTILVEAADEIEHMLLQALRRRQLTPSQRAALAVELTDYQKLRDQARRRQLANLKGQPEVATLPPRGRKTREIAADWSGTSPRLIQDAATVRDHDQKLFQQIKDGELTADAAARRVRRHLRDRQLPPPPPMPEGPFELIYADPPWQLGHPDGKYAPENHYRTRPLQEIKDDQPPTAEHAVLFLWAVPCLLPQAFEVIEAWDFTYKAELIWKKPSIGLGNWVRHQHDTLLNRPQRQPPLPRARRPPAIGDRGSPRQTLPEARPRLRADGTRLPPGQQARAVRARQTPPRLDHLGKRSRTMNQLPHGLACLEPLLEQLARRIVELQRQHADAEAEPAAQASPWMSLPRAAEYLDWPRQRLYKLTAQGAIPHHKHDGRLLFHRHELDTWLSGFAQGRRR
jgi:excisionase family DNA binding protein